MLRVERLLYVEGNVVAEVIERFAHRHNETVESAGKDSDFLKIGLPLDRLAKLCRRPVVLLANQNDGGRREFDIVVAVGIVGDEPGNLCRAPPASSCQSRRATISPQTNSLAETPD